MNATANGDQGMNGTFYVNINSETAFTKVVATSSQYAFEFDNVAYSSSMIGDSDLVAPEPSTLIFAAVGALGMIAYSRCRRRGIVLAG